MSGSYLRFPLEQLHHACPNPVTRFSVATDFHMPIKSFFDIVNCAVGS